MANLLYVSAAEPFSGKVLVSLGLLNALERTVSNIGFFRPIARPYRPVGTTSEVVDRDIHLMHEVFKLDAADTEMYGVTDQVAEELLSTGREDELHERVLAACKKLEEKCGFVLVEGTDFLSATSSMEAELNPQIARNLNAPVLMVVDGSSSDADTIFSKAKVGLDAFQEKGCHVIGVIINKVNRDAIEQLEGKVSSRLRACGVNICAKIPHEPNLSTPRMDEVAAHLGGDVLFGRNHLHNKIGKTIVASGSVETMIPLLDNNVLLVTHIDRHDAILMAIVSLMSTTSPNIGGMVLTGERDLSVPVMNLLQGLPGPRVPIVRSPVNTYETILALTRLKSTLEPGNIRELEIAKQQFDTYVDSNALIQAIRGSASQLMSPARFKFELIRRARSQKKCIVLPEGMEDRILKAADGILRLKAADLVLLGKPDEVRNKAGQLGVDLDGAQIIDPLDCDMAEEFARIYQKARAHKGMTLEAAREHIVEGPVFGTMMVHTGRADGMVAGATHSTALTIRPGLQVIKTRKGCSLVSSVFFMCLEDRVLVYGDCAVNPDPTAQELAEIAVQSADTARAFGIDPIVAMLSYSTGESGSGADVDKVKEAVKLAKRLRPDLVLEGPLQYDAAVDASVAKTKLPDSLVGGRATVFIFPDLNTGNNTYKAVQRSAHAIAVGPVLQGLNKPVNDLSRGCLVEDIVNTVAITAIQAQQA
ncbi:MAG: phosphate acetyltransferase [Pseudomonadota bacterium]